MSPKLYQLLLDSTNQNRNTFADRYMNSADFNEPWFGGFDLGSKHDYARDYMSPEQREGWANYSPDQRREILGATFDSAMKDEDRSFGQELVHKGVPLAVAAAMAYGAFTGLGGLGGGAGAGGGGAGATTAGAGGGGGLGAEALGGIADAAGNVIPGTEMVGGATAAGGSGLGSTLGKMFGIGPKGARDWGQIIKLGGAGLGALNALTNKGPGTPTAPTRPPWMDAPLPEYSFSRQQSPMNQDAYYTYGQSGGEHQFFQPSATNPGTFQPPMHIPTPITPGSPAAFVSGGKVAGPGTGRSDEIPAQLSDGEYVIDAESVALLGDGSTEAGSKKLDELRRKLRQHKGRALAKGEFSPDAKNPEDYISVKKAKGGGVHNLRNALAALPKRSPNLEEPTKEIEALRGLMETIKLRQLEEQGRRAGYDPYNSPAPKKKAEGGKVKGVNMLADYADKLENALDLGDTNAQTLITRQIAAIEPKFKLAKGGDVRALLSRMRAGLSPPSPTDYLKMKHPRGSAVVEHLESRGPIVDTRRPRTAEERLEGDELLHLLEKGAKR